jgi:PAS domain S-box-containing protein
MTSTKRRILIVEDQRLIAADIESRLRNMGYEVVGSVAEGEEAIGIASEKHPDLVLMDIRLRGPMDGIQAAASIRELIDIPVVYLTAYADEETIARARRTSPYGYLVKPFNERELRAAVEIAISKHETDRELVEERTKRRAAEEFKLLIQCVRDYAICLLDPTGRVASWNDGATRIKGYAAEDVRGQPFSIFFPKESIAAGEPQRLLERAAREGRAESEGWRVRKDGSRFWANVVITAMRGENGELHGFGKITRDLTERKKMEEDLRDAVRARDEFLQIASHELKTPLTPLQLQLDVLARALEESGLRNDRLTEKLDIAIRQTNRLERLVESLLEVSRITGGRLALDVERFDLAELVRDTTLRFRAESTRAGSCIAVQADEAIPGRWDRTRVEQILSNLLSNAVMYGKGKPIEVEAHRMNGTALVSVTDHGMGIDEEALSRIFGRFERAVSLRHFGGLGLGLFVARQLAEAHGGTLVAQSQPRAGSTFTLVLPIETVLSSNNGVSKLDRSA